MENILFVTVCNVLLYLEDNTLRQNPYLEHDSHFPINFFNKLSNESYKKIMLYINTSPRLMAFSLDFSKVKTNYFSLGFGKTIEIIFPKYESQFCKL